FYLIIVTNNGPDTAQYVRLVVRMPLNSRAEWAMSSQGECRRLDKTKVADCIVAYQLRAGERAAVTLVVVPNSTNTLTSRAGVSSETASPSKGNNVGTWRTPVKP